MISSPSRNLIIFFLLLTSSGIFFFSHIGQTGNYSRREVRPIICAREMINTGNYLIPTQGGEYRFKKPPLQYWLVSLASKLTSSQVTIFSSRMPAVIAGIFTLILSWWWTLQLREDPFPEAALFTPLILAVIPSFFNQVRSSQAEMVLCFFTLSAAYNFWKACRKEKTSGRHLIMGYIFIAGGMMTKGPIALIMPLLPYIALRKKRLFQEWKWHCSGFLIAIAPVGLWVLICCFQEAKAMDIFVDELFSRRFSGQSQHAKPFYYYFTVVAKQFALFLPVLVLACMAAFRKKSLRYLLYFVLLNFLWLSIMASKQKHYLIPLFPPLCIIMGFWLDNQMSHKKLGTYFNFFSFLLVAAALAFGLFLLPASFPVLAVAIVLLLIFLVKHKHFSLPGLWISAIYLGVLLHLFDLFSATSGNRLAYEKLMANWVENQEIDPGRLVFFNKPDPVMIYYFKNVTSFSASSESPDKDKADFILVRGDRDIRSFLEDSGFFLIKDIFERKRDLLVHRLALFKKKVAPDKESFNFRMIAIAAKEEGHTPEDLPGISELQSYYAILPETNPFIGLHAASIRNREKWNQTLFPILNQGVELVCKFDARSSLFRKIWFHDASYWGVSPEPVIRRSFFNDRYLLWVVDKQDISNFMEKFENNHVPSSGSVNLMFLQDSESNGAVVSPAQMKKLDQHGLVLVNRFLTDPYCLAEIIVDYGGVTIIQMDSQGGSGDRCYIKHPGS